MSKDILILDKNQTNIKLLTEFLQKNEFTAISACNYSELDQLIHYIGGIKLVLMDISGFDKTIWDYCKLFQEQNVPMLILSAKQNHLLQKESLKHGIKGIINKPLVLNDFLTLLNSMVYEQ